MQPHPDKKRMSSAARAGMGRAAKHERRHPCGSLALRCSLAGRAQRRDSPVFGSRRSSRQTPAGSLRSPQEWHPILRQTQTDPSGASVRACPRAIPQSACTRPHRRPAQPACLRWQRSLQQRGVGPRTHPEAGRRKRHARARADLQRATSEKPACDRVPQVLFLTNRLKRAVERRVQPTPDCKPP